MSPISTFLDGRATTRLRGLMFLALSDVGHIVTQQVTSDAGGGGTAVWTAGSASIPCRVDDLTGGEQLATERVSDRSTHAILVPSGSVATPIDRFAITGRGTFEITAVRDHTREWVQTLEAVRVNPV